MDKYTIFNLTTDETHVLYIHEIFDLIRQRPECEYYKLVNDKPVLIHNETVLNTEFICHRINTVEELRNIPPMFGVELDLRDGEYNQIYLQHDPYIRGGGECFGVFFRSDSRENLTQEFESYLKSYNHKTMILNIKSERIEPRCIELMNEYEIQTYFFLDSNLPMIYLLNSKYHNTNIACRFSEFEPIEGYRRIKHMISWVWCDCFTFQPLTRDIYDEIQSDKKRICIVSPELQGRPHDIQKHRDHFIEKGVLPDAICCKITNIIHWI